MKIEGSWKGGSKETHVGETVHEVGEANAKEMGQAIREHLMEVASSHFAFHTEDLVLKVTFER